MWEEIEEFQKATIGKEGQKQAAKQGISNFSAHPPACGNCVQYSICSSLLSVALGPNYRHNEEFMFRKSGGEYTAQQFFPQLYSPMTYFTQVNMARKRTGKPGENCSGTPHQTYCIETFFRNLSKRTHAHADDCKWRTMKQIKRNLPG